MKKVYFIRHGKSSWDNLLIDDYDRPLNKRGERDVPFMANLLKQRGVKPDIIISSPAKRAKTTAKIFADILEVENIIFKDVIYGAEVSDIITIMNDGLKEYDTIFIIGHNPTMTETVNSLIDEEIDNIPTTGVVEVDPLSKAFTFDYPKQYLR